MKKAREYFDKNINIIDKLDYYEIESLRELVMTNIVFGNKIIVAGNGGSALNAFHFAQDLLKHMKIKNGQIAKVFALGSNPGLQSAIENDLGHSESFVLELSTFASIGDLFIPISVSGTSKNLIKATEWAKENGLYTVSITGNENIENGLASIVDEKIVIPSNEFSYVEDLSMSILHYIVYSIWRENEND